VESKWKSYSMDRSGIFVLKEKLKFLKRDLKVWNKEIFGNLNLQRKDLIKRISNLDKKDDESSLNDEKKLERKELFSELEVVSLRQEALWKQKSRAKWIAKGDSNSKYFHSLVNWRRNKNEIKGVECLGKWCDKPEVVKGLVKDYFKERLTDSTSSDIRLGKVDFQTISPREMKC